GETPTASSPTGRRRRSDGPETRAGAKRLLPPPRRQARPRSSGVHQARGDGRPTMGLEALPLSGGETRLDQDRAGAQARPPELPRESRGLADPPPIACLHSSLSLPQFIRRLVVIGRLNENRHKPAPRSQVAGTRGPAEDRIINALTCGRNMAGVALTSAGHRR